MSHPTTQIWIALAKPPQALTLVLAQLPDGWTAKIIPADLTEQQSLLNETNLKPGETLMLLLDRKVRPAERGTSSSKPDRA